MFDTSQLMAASGAAGFYDTEIEQSLRFNDDDSAYLSRTPASAGNRKTWTWSGWVKRGNQNSQMSIFGNDDTSGFRFRIESGNQLRALDGNNGIDLIAITTAVFRDSSAWYHIVLCLDTTQAAGSDRVKIYVNGIQHTLTYTYTPTQNQDLSVNATTEHRLSNAGGYGHFDGYLSEVNFIDGTALDADSFGEFKSGVWIPKAYSGSYGTNGFYLDFGNSGSIGADVSGNGNNWTANNLAATDVVLDSPTNNFATLNVLDAIGNDNTYSEGNLKAVINTGTNDEEVRATFGLSSGKWYWEHALISTTTTAGYLRVGLKSSDGSDYWIVRGSDGETEHNGSTSSSSVSYTTGDIVGLAYDADAGTLDVSVNGTFVNDVHTSISGDLHPYLSNATSTGGTHTCVSNFGQDSSFAGNKTAQGNTDDNGYGDFYYAPPSGYLALCTANLPDPVASIDPAQDGSPQDHFNTVLYTGANPNAAQSITGVGFQPDFLWIKSRVTGYGHALQDAVRGSTKRLQSDTTGAESTSATYVSSFDSDGFSLGTDFGQNAPNEPYVAWNWKAGGSGSSNTDGSITSTVSANTDAGFSIVSWTDDGTFTGTIGHGLSQTPEFYIIKNRESTENWSVYNTVQDGSLDLMQLNGTGAKSDSGASMPTSTTIQFGDSLGNDMIAYCFHSVDGFSKFGSYTGNGSTDGSFIYTGFRPALIVVKNITSSTGWEMYDNEREGFNPENDVLRANDSIAELSYSGRTIDLVSNGFKLRSSDTPINASGNNYIYMAFAEMPAKYSLGR